MVLALKTHLHTLGFYPKFNPVVVKALITMPPKKTGAAPTRVSTRNKVKTTGASNATTQQKLDHAIDEDVKADAGTKRNKDEAELDEGSVKNHATRTQDTAAPKDAEGEEPATKKAKVSDVQEKNDEMTHDDADLIAEPTNGILERGHVYFFYRTKVNLATGGTTPTSIDDVAKFHFLLLPRPDNNVKSKNQKQPFRFCVVGKKRLPDPLKGKREVFWSTVEKVGKDLATEKLGDAEGGLGERNYSTKTRGDRHVDPARVTGRGHYALFSPKPDTPSQRAVHLVYFLTHPAEADLGDVQRELSIYSSGSLIIQVRNPTSSQNPPGVGLSPNKRADYPEEVIEHKFGGDADHGASCGRKFIAPNPVGLLDFVGTEMLLIGEKRDAEEVLKDGGEGIVEEAMEQDAEQDAEEMKPEDVLKELRLDEETFPCDVLEGDWL
ncbi:hypothetical protein FRB93_011724 [Tulasnella sp. JGI-2019a]|nr:hypothetical protein FRB93_011724 [Tulasnella sp. JGI-2019a]